MHRRIFTCTQFVKKIPICHYEFSPPKFAHELLKNECTHVCALRHCHLGTFCGKCAFAFLRKQTGTNIVLEMRSGRPLGVSVCFTLRTPRGEGVRKGVRCAHTRNVCIFIRAYFKRMCCPSSVAQRRPICLVGKMAGMCTYTMLHTQKGQLGNTLSRPQHAVLLHAHQNREIISKKMFFYTS